MKCQGWIKKRGGSCLQSHERHEWFTVMFMMLLRFKMEPVSRSSLVNYQSSTTQKEDPVTQYSPPMHAAQCIFVYSSCKKIVRDYSEWEKVQD